MISKHSGLKRFSVLILLAGVIFFSGCSGIGYMIEKWRASSYDKDIERAGRAIAASTDTKQRAAAYAERADAYSEKSHYSRLMKLISDEEYSRLFDLALADYNQAIALEPESAEMYYRRGNAYYSRAGLDMIYAPYRSDFLAPAKADFSRVVAQEPKNAMALDMLGLTDGSMGDWTAALADFEQEVALNPDMRFRISDAYCNRGSRYAAAQHDLAISDLKRAIEMRATSDGCECEPYNPLLAIYLRTQQYDKAREVAAQAKSSKQWIAPEYLTQLKAAGGR